MFFPALLVAAFSGVSRVAAVTASDLPDCAVECYVNANQKVGLQLEDYEGRCRSAPFQLAMRFCAAKECDYDEYTFVAEEAQKYCQENFGVDLREIMMAWDKKEDTVSTSTTTAAPSSVSASVPFTVASSMTESSSASQSSSMTSTTTSSEATATPSAAKSGATLSTSNAWLTLGLPIVALGMVFTCWA